MSLSISSHIHVRGNTMRFMTPEMFGSSLTFSHTQKIQNTILPYIPKQIAGVFIRKETFLDSHQG